MALHGIAGTHVALRTRGRECSFLFNPPPANPLLRRARRRACEGALSRARAPPAYSPAPVHVQAHVHTDYMHTHTRVHIHTIVPWYRGIREWHCRGTLQEDNAPPEHFGFQPHRGINPRSYPRPAVLSQRSHRFPLSSSSSRPLGPFTRRIIMFLALTPRLRISP